MKHLHCAHAGPGVDSYDSPYWKQRGHPRFFRYLKPAPGGVNKSIRNASWQPMVRNDADSDEPAAGAPVGDFSASLQVRLRPPQNPPKRTQRPFKCWFLTPLGPIPNN